MTIIQPLFGQALPCVHTNINSRPLEEVDLLSEEYSFEGCEKNVENRIKAVYFTHGRVLDNHALTIQTNIMVLHAVVHSTLLYAFKTWAAETLNFSSDSSSTSCHRPSKFDGETLMF